MSKELEMMSGLNSYDYGARQYNSVVPAWDRVDPLCEKYYSISPYAYCANNPIRFIDPDGEATHIKISAVPMENEKGPLRVVDSSNNSAVNVPLYSMYVWDDKDPDNVTSYLVTRDALSDKGDKIVNYAFEPSEDFGEYLGEQKNFPTDTNFTGVKLKNFDGSFELKTDDGRPKKDKEGVAIGIYIHVGE